MIRVRDAWAPLARHVLDVTVGIKPGQRVWVHSWDHTLDLASALMGEAKARGCPALLTVQPEDAWLRSILRAPLRVIEGLPPHERAALNETDVYLYTLGPRTPIPWKSIPPRRREAITLWFGERNRFVKEWMTIAKKRKVKMVGIEATLATPERAKMLGLDPRVWSDVMVRGCMADGREMARCGRALAEWIGGRGDVRITTPHGTDLRFKLDARPVNVGDGLASPGEVVFLPTGDLEVSAEEQSAEGVVVFDRPAQTGRGPVVKLVVHVSGGRISKRSAASGLRIFEDYLRGRGDMDRFAFFGFGLNPHLRFGFTQDDKVLGGVTVGFGDNEGKGGRNRADRDWWACMTRATVTIGGRCVMKQGRLLAR